SRHRRQPVTMHQNRPLLQNGSARRRSAPSITPAAPRSPRAGIRSRSPRRDARARPRRSRGAGARHARARRLRSGRRQGPLRPRQPALPTGPLRRGAGRIDARLRARCPPRVPVLARPDRAQTRPLQAGARLLSALPRQRAAARAGGGGVDPDGPLPRRIGSPPHFGAAGPAAGGGRAAARRCGGDRGAAACAAEAHADLQALVALDHGRGGGRGRRRRRAGRRAHRQPRLGLQADAAGPGDPMTRARRAPVPAALALALTAALGLALALSLGGCGGDGLVDLTIALDPAVPDATVAQIRSLTMDVTGLETTTVSDPLAAPFAANREERVVVRSPAGGAVTLAITARDGSGAPLAFGQVSFTL